MSPDNPLRRLRLLWLGPGLLLGACQLPAPAPVNSSQYACPDGRVVRAGLSADQRHLRLTVQGRSHTLSRRAALDDYSNGYYTVRLDDLFLHLSQPGVLLPQHCRLLVGGEAAAVISSP
ncbi:MAG: hypothetical protein K0Q68_950 [Moraxellaceae bacterium]|jgi:hypothetical protein|nr:hypothetical protein [Moraxellaceae bacterium]